MASDATTNTAFNPEVWSTSIMEEYRRHINDQLKPKRSKAAQMLRDAALGHPEYPEKSEFDLRGDRYAMTATELVMRQQQAEMELKRIQHQIESPIYKGLFGDEKWQSRA